MTVPLVKPAVMLEPFAKNGTKNTIPQAASGTPGRASLDLGFPPLTFTPIQSGGVPPSGADFNGILNFISQYTAWVGAGGMFTFDASLSTFIGGYSKGMVLQSNDGLSTFISLVDNNTADFNSTPSSIGPSWAPYAGFYSAIKSYAGNPNTHVAGTQAIAGQTPPSILWDTVNSIFWICTSTGTTSTAVWVANDQANNTIFCGTSTGSANAQVLTPTVPLPAYAAGVALSFVAGFTNSGALTVNVSGLGVKNVYKSSPTGPVALTGGEVIAANLLSMRYDGTRFQLTSTELGTAALANASSNTGVVAAMSGAATVGHLAVFSTTGGTLVDGGPAGVAPAPTYITSATNLVPGVYAIDTTAGAFACTLSAAPATGDVLQFFDMYGTMGTNNFTLNRNGKTIMSLAEDMIFNVPGLAWSLEYTGTTWRLQ